MTNTRIYNLLHQIKDKTSSDYTFLQSYIYTEILNEIYNDEKSNKDYFIDYSNMSSNINHRCSISTISTSSNELINEISEYFEDVPLKKKNRKFKMFFKK